MLEWTTQGFTQLCFKQSFKANKMKIKWLGEAFMNIEYR